jgi:hypothetical protein
MQITFLRSSSFNRWDWCQHLFVMEYGMGLKGPANKKAEAGNIIHKAMEGVALYKLGCQKNLKSIEYPGLPDLDISKPIDIDDIYEKSFHFYSNQSIHKYSPKDKEEYRGWLDYALNYKNGFYSPLLNTVFGVEQSFDVEIKKDWAKYKFDLGPNKYEGYLRLKGNIDLILDHGSYIEAIDYKTSQKRNNWNKDYDNEKGYEDFLKDPQLCIYYYALAHLYPDKEFVMSIFYIRAGGVFSIPFDRSYLPRIEEMIKSRFQEIKQTSIPSLLSRSRKHWKCKSLCFASKVLGKTSLCQHVQNEIDEKGLKQAIIDNTVPGFDISDYGYGGGAEGLKTRDV